MAKQSKETKSKAEEFIEKYQQLCEEHGHQITVQPVYVRRDDGSWTTVIQTSVGELPKREDLTEDKAE